MTRPDASRKLPYSEEDERHLLGCILQDPKIIFEVNKRFGPEALHDERHKRIYRAMEEMAGEDKHIDIATLTSHILRDSEASKYYGGAAYLTQVSLSRPTAQGWEEFAENIETDWKLRRCLGDLEYLSHRCLEMRGEDVHDLQDLVRGKLGWMMDEGGSANGLPEPVSLDTLDTEELPEPLQLIHGILHKEDILLVGGGSKSFKTWVLMALGVCICYGMPWLGCETEAGSVIYINFEIKKHSARSRLRRICERLGVKMPKNFVIWNLRGHASDFDTLLPKITARIKADRFALIILDPLYKGLGGRDENAAGDMGELMNAIELMTVETGAACAVAAHFAKGVAAHKGMMDRMSGSGVLARATDSILTLTKHKIDDCYTVDVTTRNFAPHPSFVVRWDFPIMELVPEADPGALDGAKQKNQKKMPSLTEFLGLWGKGEVLSLHAMKNKAKAIGWNVNGCENLMADCIRRHMFDDHPGRTNGVAYSVRPEALWGKPPPQPTHQTDNHPDDLPPNMNEKTGEQA